MASPQNERPLEPEVHRDLEGRLTYAGYLHLDRLLSAQHPLSNPSLGTRRIALATLERLGIKSAGAGRNQTVKAVAI